MSELRMRCIKCGRDTESFSISRACTNEYEVCGPWESVTPESPPLLHRIEAMTKGLTLGSLTAADFVRYADGAPGAFAALARAVWELYDQKEELRSKASGADSLESELEQEAIAAAGLRVEVEALRRQLDDAKLALAKSQKETAWLHDRLTKTKELFDAYQKGGTDGTLP